uniref:Uncharacterized protein n=1 Tax=Arundo donax TaxID=35708 RepID=A0A0A8YAB1_ARUDO
MRGVVFSLIFLSFWWYLTEPTRFSGVFKLGRFQSRGDSFLCLNLFFPMQ